MLIAIPSRDDDEDVQTTMFTFAMWTIKCVGLAVGAIGWDYPAKIHMSVVCS